MPKAAPSTGSGTGRRTVSAVHSSAAKISIAKRKCGASHSGGGEVTPGSIPVRTSSHPNTACAPPAANSASSQAASRAETRF